jgi:hypothetical protein
MSKREKEDGSEEPTILGLKFSQGKIRYSLVDPIGLRQEAAIMTFGAEKYEPQSWQQVEDGIERYTESLLRHIHDFLGGEDLDKDTGMHHLAHARCNTTFLLYFLDKLGRVPDFDSRKVQRKFRKIREKYREQREEAQRAARANRLECAPGSESDVCSPGDVGDNFDLHDPEIGRAGNVSAEGEEPVSQPDDTGQSASD